MDRQSRVLVTGATGFVGSHLVEALSPRVAAVRALVRPTSDVTHLDSLRIEHVVGGPEDGAGVAEAMRDVDVVFHLAAATRARGLPEYHAANVEGTRVVVEAALEARPRPGRFIYLSTLAAVGPSTDGPARPYDTPRPLTSYGETKRAGELVCLAAGSGMDVVVLRPPAVYGPRDRDLLVFFRLASRGLLPLPDGGRDRRLQLIHVTDLAEALIRAGEAPAAHGIYHVADPQAYAWRDIATLIGRSVGRRARVVPVPATLIRSAAAVSEVFARVTGRPNIFNREKALELLAPGWECDVSRAAEELGFEARIPLPQGLAETAAWYRGQNWL